MYIQGRTRLKGEVEISTSKNAILPIIAATVLTDEKVVLKRVPRIKDVDTICQILQQLGKEIQVKEDYLVFNSRVLQTTPPYDLVRQMRASFLLMGALLSRCGKVRVSLPGGCAIGNRPIDLHLKGFAAMGAEIKFNGGDVIAKANKLMGNHIYLDFPSVGATENIMMAASLADGTTWIENAALEPEIVDLANFINMMGGHVSGAGTNVIKIQGVELLSGTEYTPIPDRIEAGTYLIAVAATAGEAVIKNVIPEHLKSITAKLEESGAVIEESNYAIQIKREGKIKPVYIKTLPYPGFPTDMQAQIMAYLSFANGTSVISESVFENRFMHVQELLRMGADIRTEGKSAIIRGVKELTGARVRASDLRAGAALIIAGLSAQGKTIVTENEHVERGYEDIDKKLKQMGAQIYLN
ncbi:MAG TPA: UDP-N-acetylglucosamine 1-carboxyvinyltransferase [Syntrophomonas sp.]|nr:UDP-N-acetylglucosamine 1-carboxyvinyltransferase [Syntrophomonas sp.]HRW11667.1 UDP-N-acetylglucosamine 1-carboxyvinyltransferase [Syntrophomonas sp.]